MTKAANALELCFFAQPYRFDIWQAGNDGGVKNQSSYPVHMYIYGC